MSTQVLEFLRQLRKLNTERSFVVYKENVFQTPLSWWSLKVAGEVGEALNGLKKWYFSSMPLFGLPGQGCLVEECCDVLIYSDHWAARCGLACDDLEDWDYWNPPLAINRPNAGKLKHMCEEMLLSAADMLQFAGELERRGPLPHRMKERDFGLLELRSAALGIISHIGLNPMEEVRRKFNYTSGTRFRHL